MGRSQETYNKKEVRNKREKKRKEKAEKRQARKENKEKKSLDDMIAYVDENGVIIDTPPDPEKKTEIEAEDIVVGVPSKSPEDKPDPIRKGTVTFMNDSKGYGFIKDAENKESVFMHVNNTEEEIHEGDIVTFEIEKGPRGLNAVRIKLYK